MRPKAIHQFHSGSAYGDAVTNSLFYTRQILRDLGFRSEIYVENIADELASELRSYRYYEPSSNQILFVHHSMGHDLINWILSLPDLKILVYHNITPAHFFPEGSALHGYTELGRKQLNLLKSSMIYSICVSFYNANELKSFGYENVSVIPLVVDLKKIRNSSWNSAIVNLHAGTFSVLFVGRIVENKCQHDVIEIFHYLKDKIGLPSQLIIIGGYDKSSHYYQKLLGIIREYKLEAYVSLLGKVPNEDLYGWYRASDVFVCMSEHEGFGVPLIESMAFDLPVIAYKSSSVPYTMGGAGIMVQRKDPVEIAALISILSKDRALRRAIVRQQRKRLHDFVPSKIKEDLINILSKIGVNVPNIPVQENKDFHYLHWQIEGPFETSYSLAIVNRELALALDQEEHGKVAIFATEGPGDYNPRMSDIKKYPGLDALWARGVKMSMANVVIRNLYPPRTTDMDGLVNLLYHGWEESNYPQKWVREFNYNLDGIVVWSKFVKKVLIDAGVYVPVKVVGCGADCTLQHKRIHYSGHLGKSFRFLHISSCFPRKGIDVLLNAYANAFTSSDNVSLIIKTFPNIHNTVEEQIKKLQKSRSNCPDVILINEEFPVGQLVDLYNRCHAFVAPSRGEGFGLPLAEAMLFELPVITTGFGGQSDFCTEETCWIIDYHFKPSESHIGLPNSVWAEPDVEHLTHIMKKVYQAPADILQKKTVLAKQMIKLEYTWKRCAERIRETVRKIESRSPLSDSKINLGWVTTWNTKCGVATYSSYLLEKLTSNTFNIKLFASREDVLINEDGDNVIRCWGNNANTRVDDLKAAITHEGVKVVVIQFNFGFFEIKAFGELIESLHNHGIKTIIIFHSTKDVDKPGLKMSLGQISTQLSLADRLLVHGVSDLNRFKNFGLVNNVTLFPHGMLNRPIRDPISLRARAGLSCQHIIASYGFLLPQKGIQELIVAFPQILSSCPGTILLLVNALYPNQISIDTRQECLELIDHYGLQNQTVMVNEFLDDEETFYLLECADVVVFPYQDSSESCSGAVKVGIASNRPVACTPLEIFDDVKEIVHFLHGTAPEDISNGIIKLLHNEDILKNNHQIKQKWLKDHSWSTMGYRLSGMIQAIVNDS